jgi:hypothetical protein
VIRVRVRVRVRVKVRVLVVVVNTVWSLLNWVTLSPKRERERGSGLRVSDKG